MKTLLAAAMIVTALGGPGDNELDQAADKIGQAARQSLQKAVEESAADIVRSITGQEAAPNAPSIPVSKIAGAVELTKFPNKDGYGMGMVRANAPGGWVVFKSTSVGFEFVETLLLEGEQASGYKSCAFQEVPGTYGVLFLEKDVTQPRVINVTIGGVGPGPNPNPNPNPDPDPVPPSKFGLREHATSLLATLSEAEKSRKVLVTMPDGNVVQVTAMQGVGAVYYEVGQMIKNEDITSVEQLGPALSSKTRAVLEQGTGPGNWPDKVIIPLGQKANELWQGGTIKNLADWGDALIEISEAFK